MSFVQVDPKSGQTRSVEEVMREWFKYIAGANCQECVEIRWEEFHQQDGGILHNACRPHWEKYLTHLPPSCNGPN